MGVAFKIFYHESVVRDDIPMLSTTWKKKVRAAIEEKLETHPDVYGKPLRRSLKGYRKLRVGDYRVVFRISDKSIYILAILHRSIVYEIADNRID